MKCSNPNFPYVSTSGHMEGKVCFTSVIMASKGTGPCGSFCDTGDFCKDGKCGCGLVSKCPVPYSAAYKHYPNGCVKGSNIRTYKD
jgi:hypothetical protein